MTVTVTFLSATDNVMVYTCAHDGAAGNTFLIPNVGGGSPDLTTDSDPASAIGRIMRQGAASEADAIQRMLAGNPCVCHFIGQGTPLGQWYVRAFPVGGAPGALPNLDVRGEAGLVQGALLVIQRISGTVLSIAE